MCKICNLKYAKLETQETDCNKNNILECMNETHKFKDISLYQLSSPPPPFPSSNVWEVTDIEQQGRDGGEAANVYHAQVVRQVALSGAHEEQPREQHAYETSDTAAQDDNKAMKCRLDKMCPSQFGVFPLHTHSLFNLSLNQQVQ